jgi:hypothetical protein
MCLVERRSGTGRFHSSFQGWDDPIFCLVRGMRASLFFVCFKGYTRDGMIPFSAWMRGQGGIASYQSPLNKYGDVTFIPSHPPFFSIISACMQYLYNDYWMLWLNNIDNLKIIKYIIYNTLYKSKLTK